MVEDLTLLTQGLNGFFYVLQLHIDHPHPHLILPACPSLPLGCFVQWPCFTLSLLAVPGHVYWPQLVILWRNSWISILINPTTVAADRGSRLQLIFAMVRQHARIIRSYALAVYIATVISMWFKVFFFGQLVSWLCLLLSAFSRFAPLVCPPSVAQLVWQASKLVYKLYIFQRLHCNQVQ